MTIHSKFKSRKNDSYHDNDNHHDEKEELKNNTMFDQEAEEREIKENENIDDLETTIMPELETSMKSRKVIYLNGQITDLRQLLQPSYSQCNLCPLRPGIVKGPPCQIYTPGSHCQIEEAIAIEASQSLMGENSNQLDELTLYNVLVNLLYMHRLQRIGAQVDLTNFQTKETIELLTKLVNMSGAVSGRYINSLKEMVATRKDRIRVKQEIVRTVDVFSNALRIANKANLAESPEKDDEKEDGTVNEKIKQK
jgi:hypothetical protein